MSLMQESPPKFECPQCGGLILNRGYPKCEHCNATLPAGLLFSKSEADKNWEVFVAERHAEAEKRWRIALDNIGTPPSGGCY